MKAPAFEPGTLLVCKEIQWASRGDAVSFMCEKGDVIIVLCQEHPGSKRVNVLCAHGVGVMYEEGLLVHTTRLFSDGTQV